MLTCSYPFLRTCFPAGQIEHVSGVEGRLSTPRTRLGSLRKLDKLKFDVLEEGLKEADRRGR